MNFRSYTPAVSCFFCLVLMACQSPNTTNEKGAKTPVKPKKATVADVEAGIRAHIKMEEKQGNGFFHLHTDSVDYQLKLVRVHTEYLSVLGPNRFFACVDLADENGDVYDVDFFLDGQPGAMKVTDTKVHKLNGKPRYTWKQAEDKTWFTVPVKGASNRLLGVIEGNDAFEFRYATTIPELSGPAKLWLPLAQSDPFQEIAIKTIESPVEHQLVTDQRFGNQAFYLDIQPEHSGQEVVITYRVKRTEKGPYEEPETDPRQFLGATKLIPTGDRFSTIVREVFAQKPVDSDLMKARALYDYIIDNMRYAKQGTYGTGDANFACDSKSGNCTEFHSLFISLTRSAGIPSRFAIGAAIPTARNDGGVNGYHCWAEFYAEGKWWPVDISEGNKYTALATYYFGHHPANRIELSRGRDLVFEPGPTTGPVPFFAYPLFESDGNVQTLRTSFSFVRADDSES